MKNEKGSSIKLGLFVTIGLALFIAGLYFVGQRQQLFNSSFRVIAMFKDIGGLQVGNNVRFSGITVGIIENIEQVSDTSVRVEMLIDSDTKKFIKKDAKAIIGSDGLMGNKIVQIIPGTSGQKEIQDNDVIKTEIPINMDDILEKLKTTTENSATITTNLAEITTNLKDGNGTIGMLLMDTVFAQELKITLDNIRAGAGGFKQNMDAAGKSILLRGKIKKAKKK
ncbi:MAG: MlaD family protein [Bacteroidota bacterium]|nr:MlaD family protein [Bacteroidota bacterium]